MSVTQPPSLDIGVQVKDEKQIRSVFVGNIPYEATDEGLKAIFSRVGPVLSFRIVFDRETGKPKGYGFCEYRDVETAQSAIRNLNGVEFHNRVLRVDSAVNEKGKDDKSEVRQAEFPAFGPSVPMESASEAIAKTMAQMPSQHVFELLNQMKTCIQNDPDESRELLIQNPQLGYALLQALMIMKIVDPQMIHELILRQPTLESYHVPIHHSLDQAVKSQDYQGIPDGRGVQLPFKGDHLHITKGQRHPDIPVGRIPHLERFHHLNFQQPEVGLPHAIDRQPTEPLPPIKRHSNREAQPEQKYGMLCHIDRPDIDFKRPPSKVRPPPTTHTQHESPDADLYDENPLGPDFPTHIPPPQMSKFQNDYEYHHGFERDRSHPMEHQFPHDNRQHRFPPHFESHGREGRDAAGPSSSPQFPHHIDHRTLQRPDKEPRGSQNYQSRDGHSYHEQREPGRSSQKPSQLPSDPRIPTHKASIQLPDDRAFNRDREREREREYQSGHSGPPHQGDRPSRYGGSSRFQLPNDRNNKY